MHGLPAGFSSGGLDYTLRLAGWSPAKIQFPGIRERAKWLTLMVGAEGFED